MLEIVFNQIYTLVIELKYFPKKCFYEVSKFLKKISLSCIKELFRNKQIL